MANNRAFMERRQRIKLLIENIGRWNISITELAREFKVNRKTIYKDIDKICQGIDPDDLKKMSFDLATGYKKGFKECMTILATSKDEKARISAAGQIDTMAKGLINLLETYGYKDKVAEKIETTVEVNIWEELQKELENVRKIKKGGNSKGSA